MALLLGCQATLAAAYDQAVFEGVTENSEKQLEFFLNELKLMAQNFVDSLIGIIKVTIEKLWNALVQFLYEVLGAVV